MRELSDELRAAARTRVATVATLLFGSGFCSLVYQTVWMRELRGVFGSSTPATAAVVGIFMGGLGLGGYLLGRRADLHPNPLFLYAKLEAGVATTALLTIPLLAAIEAAYFASGGSVVLGMGGATILRLLLAVILLGVPTILMGGTLPAAARSVTVSADARRRAIAVLYGVNTLGAVAGTVIATFHALETLGNRMTLVTAALLNILVAVAASVASRREEFAASGESEEAAAEPDGPMAPRSFTWVAAAVAGFAFLLMELVWYRMLGPILGGSTFTFGLILATALLGIGLGGLVYSLFEQRHPATLGLFATTCGLEAAAIAIPFALGDRLAILAALLRPLDALGFGGQILGWALIAAVVVLPAAMVSGFQFPALIALAGRGRANVGSDVGLVYASNTLGAILGSLAGGFGLMPILTAPGCWTLTAWMMIVLCAVAAMLAFKLGRRAIAGPLFAALAIVLLVRADGPTAVWRHSPIGAGRVDIAGRTMNEVRNWARMERRRLIWQAEGVESSVAMVSEDGIAFFVNGKSDGHSVADAGTQIMGGLLGSILHPSPKRSLVIGLGTGSTAGWLAKVPGMERVDVAELEPAIVEVAKACAPVNQNVMTAPNVRVLFGDAREILLVSKDRYDVVFSEPSNPYRAGISSLFTREFYSAVSGRLNDDGVFLQWVQGYEIEGRTIESIIRTIHGVFPDVQIWQTLDKDLILLASKKPVAINPAALRERIAKEPYRSALAEAWKADSAEGFLAHHVASEAFAKRCAESTAAPENTDDRNHVEFGVARSVGHKRGQPVWEIRRASDSLGIRRDEFPPGIDGKLVLRLRTSSPLVSGTEPSADPVMQPIVDAYRAGRFQEVVSKWREAGLEPMSHFETLMIADSLAQTGDAEALAYIEKLGAYDPVEPHVVKAYLLANQNDVAGAADELGIAFEGFRKWPWSDHSLMARGVASASVLGATRLEREKVPALMKSIGETFSMGNLEDARKYALYTLARKVDGQKCGPNTIAALSLFEPHVPWQDAVLRPRAQCYAAIGHPLAASAAADYEDFKAGESEAFGATLAR